MNRGQVRLCRACPVFIFFKEQTMKKVVVFVMFAVMTAALGFGQDGTADIDKWIAQYSEAIKSNPNDAEAYLGRGDAYYEKKDYDKAIADYTQGIRLDPDFEAYRFRGDAYFNKGDYDKAIADYSEALRLAPKMASYYFMRGNAHFNKGDYDKAIADYSEYIKRGGNSMAYVVRGDAYGAKGLYHTSIADYKTGLEKGYDPSGFGVDKSSKASMWFCGAMYMEITVNRFLGNSAVLTKYENWLKTVCDKNKVTRAEVETFYRQNIGALVAAAVDAEFSMVSFSLARAFLLHI
jgi:tetratricopeptide (TPR) repeat protein